MKKYLPDLVAILIFIVVSFAYFFPAVLEGRILFQHDSVGGAGAGQEAKEYYEETGERARWTNSLFGGMPTYQISPSYDSSDSLRIVEKAYHLFLPNYVWLTFVMMLGFFILLRALGVSPWLSALGGIVWAFSSYFFILISAGHIWKFITLAYIPPTIAGIVLAYRKKYLLGGIITALFIALQILSNHVQMTYYFLFVILFFAIAFFFEAWKDKELPHFFKASAVLVVAAIVGVSTNLSSLYHTYDYSKETMRGKSELTFGGEAANQTSSGLNRDYITQWSNGIGETFSLLVPNVKGGASAPLAGNKKAMEKANPMYRNIYSQLSQYWGDQPFMAGPVYVGAFVLMLFIFGLFIVKGPVKWALLAATVLSILLSWGHNFMGLTNFFIDYIPMYDKFRAVSSILVIAEFTIPLLAILALKTFLEKPQILKENMKYLYVSFGLTGGLALLFAIAPRFFFPAYIPAQEMQALQAGIPADQLAPLVANLEEVRMHIFTSDAWRSFRIVLIGTILLLTYNYRKVKAPWLIAALAVVCLLDMWSVNKRYLNDEQFVPASIRTETFKKTETDEYILQDKSLDYRVLNLASNTFNENNTSYWHKSIGGYHAAKLRRYQEMIDQYISKEMQAVYKEVSAAGGDMERVNPAAFPVLNMLNAKYIILPIQGGKTIPLENPYAYGNAWFVDNIQYVANANEEMDALRSIDLSGTAVVDQCFKETLKGVTTTNKDSLSYIRLVNYEPNQLVYESSSAEDGVAVFSEIYYPRGWKVTIDGKPAQLGRANYILRTLYIPAGSHTIEMSFKPTSLKITESIAYVGLALLLIGTIVLLLQYRRGLIKKEQK